MILYSVCCTSRSGSSYLCELLTSAGLGIPDEYFNPNDIRTGRPFWETSLGLPEGTDDATYRNALLENRSQSGVFGYKAVRAALYGSMTPAGFVRPVLLRRRDTLRQAISLYRAESSRLWRLGTPGGDPRAVPFDRKKILTRRKRIESANERWIEFLALLASPIHCLWYEDLRADPLGEILKIRDFLGADVEIDEVSASISIMGDDITEQWLGRL